MNRRTFIKGLLSSVAVGAITAINIWPRVVVDDQPWINVATGEVSSGMCRLHIGDGWYRSLPEGAG